MWPQARKIGRGLVPVIQRRGPHDGSNTGCSRGKIAVPNPDPEQPQRLKSMCSVGGDAGHLSIREVGSAGAFSAQSAWFSSPDPCSLSELPSSSDKLRKILVLLLPNPQEFPSFHCSGEINPSTLFKSVSFPPAPHLFF